MSARVTPTLPAIVAALTRDAELALEVAAMIDGVTKPGRPGDVALRHAARELADRLTRRTLDLGHALDGLAAHLSLGAKGVMP